MIRFGWILLLIGTLGIAAAGFLIRPPEPHASIAIDRITLSSASGLSRQMTLPHLLSSWGSRDVGRIHYVARFDLPSQPGTRLFLLLPAFNHPLSVVLNGQRLFDSKAHLLWLGPLTNGSAFVRLPAALLRSGANTLSGSVAVGRYIMPAYLSRIYIGSEASLWPTFKLRTLLEQRLKIMALAAQVPLSLGIIFGYLCRPRDRLFRWFAGGIALSFLLALVYFVGFRPQIRVLLPYITALLPLMGLLALGTAFALADIQLPRSITVAVLAASGVAMLLVAGSDTRTELVLLMSEVASVIAALFGATAVVAWGSLQRGNIDARLMLAPYFLASCFVVRDTAAVTGILDRSLLITPYARILMLVAMICVLMRRLAATLGSLDRANETLTVRLAAREAELAELHREERVEAARLVRDAERQRLTQDLHDGISGHLVSIIAMAERSPADLPAIEQTARHALDDLRLVIYSLDLDDHDLPLALASFRERLIPQLGRIGVDLDWSTADLPEVSGVTPGNALAILRILQEAVTNAVRHGPASRISVHATATPEGQASIVVENDGHPFIRRRGGQGLENMRRRAHQLHGSVLIRSLPQGVSVTLLLPAHLPDVEAGTIDR